MLTWFLIYLFVMIESITALFSGYGWFIAFGVALLALLTLFSAFAADHASCSSEYTAEQGKWSYWWGEDKSIGKFKKLGKSLLWTGVVFMVLTHLIPSQKNLAIIVGSGITYEVITSETGKRIGGKAIELLEQKVDEALKSEKEEPKAEAPKKDGKVT